MMQIVHTDRRWRCLRVRLHDLAHVLRGRPMSRPAWLPKDALLLEVLHEMVEGRTPSGGLRVDIRPGYVLLRFTHPSFDPVPEGADTPVLD